MRYLVETRLRGSVVPPPKGPPAEGDCFLMTPRFSEDGVLLPVCWMEDCEAYEESEVRESEIPAVVAPEDIATNFNFVGEEVLDYVAAKMGVIGDVTIGGTLTNLPLRGGEALLRGLARNSPRNNSYTWVAL